MKDIEFTRGYLEGFRAAVANIDGPSAIMFQLMTADPEGVARRILQDGTEWIEPYVASELEARERRYQDQRRAERATGVSSSARRGTVYALLDREFARVKIGFTTNIRHRMRSIGLAAGRELELIVELPGTTDDERVVHERLAADRQHGEWFAWTPGVQAWVTEVTP